MENVEQRNASCCQQKSGLHFDLDLLGHACPLADRAHNPIQEGTKLAHLLEVRGHHVDGSAAIKES